MADISNLKRGQIFGAHMAVLSIIRTSESFGVAKRSLENNVSNWERRKSLLIEVKLDESENCLIGTVGLLSRLFGKINLIHLRKLQLSLMTISRTQFPQKL